MGFFSWGLEQRTPLSTSIARRQIDDCDYVVILLGSQYGEQSVSGAGYMHLEYEYALSRSRNLLLYSCMKILNHVMLYYKRSSIRIKRKISKSLETTIT
jgi:hypothetical protein